MLEKIQTLVLLLLLMGSEMVITGHFLHLTQRKILHIMVTHFAGPFLVI